jgi:hydrogenase expression/formation protein HypE
MTKQSSDKILLDHGSGGKISHRLTTDFMLPVFDNPILAALNDGALLEIDGRRLAFSTDTYTVDPIFFPGGHIGDLAVNGTVNDVGDAARAAGVQVVTGDTKVVPRGAADKIFINTSGIGLVACGVSVASHLARPGDRILLSGSLADHGVTVLTQREGMRFTSSVQSDTAPFNHMVRAMLAAAPGIHVLRDPTRGGLGTALNEIAASSDVGIRISEQHLPVKGEVAGICELLGMDPLYLANEGKLIAFVAPEAAGAVMRAMRQDPAGRLACDIGEVVVEHPGTVVMQTLIGGSRIVDMLTGEQLPRIC